MARSAKSSKPNEIKRSYEYILGYEACNRYISRHKNPYKSDTPEYDEWKAGWNKRFYGEDMYSEP